MRIKSSEGRVRQYYPDWGMLRRSRCIQIFLYTRYGIEEDVFRHGRNECDSHAWSFPLSTGLAGISVPQAPNTVTCIV